MSNVAARLQARLDAQVIEQARRELGIPDGEQVACFARDAEDLNPEWAGFHLEFFGTVAPMPPPPPAYIYAESDDGIGIRVWRVRVRHADRQAYIEAQTLPGWIDYLSIDLRNVDRSSSDDNELMLKTGMRMLYPSYFLSGPKGRRFTVEDIESAYRTVLQNKPSEHPLQHQVATELGCRTRTIRRVLDDEGLDWETFAARIRRSLRSRTVRILNR